ncbi:MAG: hypothetical protein ABIZ80_01275, partial [Bryobacteraceae bacterium]
LQAAAKLELNVYCVPEQVRSGPLRLTVTADGARLAPAEIAKCGQMLQRTFNLPASLAGKETIEVVVEVDRTFRPADETRDLGLVFGSFEVK